MLSQKKMKYTVSQFLGKNIVVIKNMLVLAVGTGFAQVINFLVMPILTRIYSDSDIGLYTVFVSALELLAPFVTLRYVSAIGLPKRTDMAVIVYVLCLFICIFMSFVACIILNFIDLKLINNISLKYIFENKVLFCVGLLSIGLYESSYAFSVREKQFKAIAKSTIVQSISSNILKLSLSFYILNAFNLILGKIIGQIFAIVCVSTEISKYIKKYRQRFTRNRFKFIALRYSDIPKFQIPSRFLLILSQKVPLLFFAAMFGSSMTGQLGLSMSVLAIPISLVAQNTGQAFYSEIAKIGRKNSAQIMSMASDLSIKLFILSVGPVLILIGFGPYIFEIVFGESWRIAGIFSSILSIYMMMQFVTSSLIHIITLYEQQKLYLFINFVRCVLSCFVFLISFILDLDEYVTLTMYSLTVASHYLYTLYLLIKVVPLIKINSSESKYV